MCDHHSSYPHVVCSYCQSFDYSVNSCPYYDISDECYAILNAMIETMNEQHTHFDTEMRECGLLHETDPSLSFPRLEASLYDDCESFLPLESDVVDDATLTDLEEVFDPPLTSFSFVTPSFSCTPMDTSVSDLTFVVSPLLLAQCMGLEMDEISKGDASDKEYVSLGW